MSRGIPRSGIKIGPALKREGATRADAPEIVAELEARGLEVNRHNALAVWRDIMQRRRAGPVAASHNGGADEQTNGAGDRVSITFHNIGRARAEAFLRALRAL